MTKFSENREVKKIISFTAAIALCSGVMAGCGEKKNDAKTDEGTTISWLIPGDKPADLALVQDEVNKIVEPEIDAKVEFRFINAGSYTEKMNMSFSSQEVFDICFTGYVNPFDTTANKGAYMPLDELLEKTPKLKESIPDWLWETGKRDGVTYAVPNYQVCSGRFVPFVYTELIDECGLDLSVVKEPKDLEILFEKIKEKRPDLYPWRISSGITMFKQDDGEELTGDIYIDRNDPSLTVKENVEDKDHSAYDTIRSWYEKGYIRSDVASVGDDTLDWTNGKYAVFQSTYKPGVEKELEIRLGKPVTAIMLGKPYVTRAKCTAAMTAISKVSKNPEKAIKLIELVNTNKDLYNLICYGIEGKHYTKLDNGTVRLDSNSGYFINASWKFGNQFNAYPLEGNSPDVWDETIKMNEEAEKSPLLGFVMNTTPIQSEISQVSSVTGEYGGFLNGSVDYKPVYDEYVSRVKAAGVDRIRDEVQKQIDEYKKTKN